MSTRLIVPFYVCLVFIAIVSGTCFWIDGTVAPDRFTCYDLNSVGASMCCDSAFSKDFDKCIGGICVYNYSSGARGLYDHGQSFYRDSCTDRAWQDPACLAMAPCKRSSTSRSFQGVKGVERQYANRNKANMQVCQISRVRKPV